MSYESTHTCTYARSMFLVALGFVYSSVSGFWNFGVWGPGSRRVSDELPDFTRESLATAAALLEDGLAESSTLSNVEHWLRGVTTRTGYCACTHV